MSQNSLNVGFELNFSPTTTALSVTDDENPLMDNSDFTHEREVENAWFHVRYRSQLRSALKNTQNQIARKGSVRRVISGPVTPEVNLRPKRQNVFSSRPTALL